MITKVKKKRAPRKRASIKIPKDIHKPERHNSILSPVELLCIEYKFKNNL